MLTSTLVFAESKLDWVYLKDYNVSYPMQILGTYRNGNNVTEPRPQESEYLKVEYGGMVVLDQGVGFFLKLKMKKRPKSKYYITIEYPNPTDKSNPMTNDVPFNPTNEEFLLSSPSLIDGIAGYGDYKISIRLYKDEESMELIETLTQEIRSYVDTREGDTRIFRKVLNTVLN